MKRPVLTVLALALVLSGCAGLRDSRLNPFNWFGGERESRVAAAAGEVVDPRGLVDQIVSLRVDRMPGGAIVNAIGLPPTQGHWDGELVRRADVPAGTLSYEFRLRPPPAPTRTSTQQSREVLVGTFVSDQALQGIRTIEVIGASNRRSVRR